MGVMLGLGATGATSLCLVCVRLTCEGCGVAAAVAAAAPPPYQVEVSRLESAVRSLHKQLGEAEADYLTGTQRLAQLHREVSNTHTHTHGGRGDGGCEEVACSNSTRLDCLDALLC